MMKKVKLGEVLDVTRGASLSGNYYSTSGHKIRLTLGNFNYPGGGFKENTSKENIYFTGPIRGEFIMHKGDIITPLTEQVTGLLGETARIPTDGIYIQSGDIGHIIPDSSKLDDSYAYYLIASPSVKRQLGLTAQQTKIRHTSPEKIKDCDVWLPNLEYQRKVGKLLDSINDKISNNNAIASQLESIEKTIYDYWFLQFDFPDENGRPYKSSGGKMVWNEKLKMEIPAGWREKKLKEISKLVMNSVNPSDNLDSIYIHYSIPAYDDYGYPVSEYGKEINSGKYSVPDNSILVSKLNPQFKRIWVPINYEKNSICSTEFIPFVPKKRKNKSFLYSLLNSDAFQNYMIQCSSSSTGSRKRIQPELCGEYKLAYPDSNEMIIERFCSITDEMQKKKQSIAEENHQLISLRNFLLPILMNGQVTFKEQA